MDGSLIKQENVLYTTEEQRFLALSDKAVGWLKSRNESFSGGRVYGFEYKFYYDDPKRYVIFPIFLDFDGYRIRVRTWIDVMEYYDHPGKALDIAVKLGKKYGLDAGNFRFSAVTCWVEWIVSKSISINSDQKLNVGAIYSLIKTFVEAACKVYEKAHELLDEG